MPNKEELIKEIRFLSNIYAGNRNDVIADISSDLKDRYSSMNMSECIAIVKETL